jgi:hypothetical protein
LQAFPPESAWAPQKDRPPTGQSHIGRPENVITVQEHRSRRSGAVGAAAGQAAQTHRAPASPRAVLIHRTRSNTMTLRRLSALRIFLFGGLSPVRTILIIEGATPFFFAHSFWLPARFTSERSNRITSFWSNARMVCFRTAAFRWRPRRSAHTLLHFPAHRSPRPQCLRELNQGESPGGLAHPSKRGARYLGIGSGPSVKKAREPVAKRGCRMRMRRARHGAF